MAIGEGSGSAIRRQAMSGDTMSRGAYNATIGILLIVGFGILALASWATITLPQVTSLVRSNELAIGIGAIVLTIVGMVLIGVGGSKQSAALMLVGYLVFAVAFGATSSIWLPRYGIDTVTNAFLVTAGICLLFTLLGALFPGFFARAVGVAFVVLLGVILAGVVCAFLHVSNSWIDYVTIGVFSIFIGYDTYQAQQVEPNMFNAVLSATNIFVDIVNIFLSVLSIMDDD